jgi:hypothetical protein
MFMFVFFKHARKAFRTIKYTGLIISGLAAHMTDFKRFFPKEEDKKCVIIVLNTWAGERGGRA